MLRILVLTASPSTLQPISAEAETAAIKANLKGGEHGAQFDIEICHEATVDILSDKMRQYKPDILHFSGHAMKGKLLFEGGSAGHPVPRAALTRLLELQRGQLRCVVLSACETVEQARDIARVIDCAVGVLDSIQDEEAIDLSKGFYASLAAGESLGRAFELAKNRVQLGGSDQHDSIRLFCRTGIDADHLVLNYCVPLICIAAEADSSYTTELLDTHLAPLIRANVLRCFEPSRALDAWDLEAETQAQLEAAQLAIVLLSPDLLASKSRMALAMRALERHNKRAARLVPILIRPLAVDATPFKSLPILPSAEKALSEHRQRDSAWVTVVQTLRRMIDGIAEKHKAGPGSPPAASGTPQASDEKSRSARPATPASSAPSAQAAAAALTPTAKSVRALLYEQFRTDSDFMAFVLDNFNQTYRLLAQQADRETRTSFLLDRHSPSDIVHAAAQYPNFKSLSSLLTYA